MEQKTFNIIVISLFSLVGITHLFRIINAWDVNIHTFVVPMWFSWVAVLFFIFMIYQGSRMK